MIALDTPSTDMQASAQIHRDYVTHSRAEYSDALHCLLEEGHSTNP